MSRIVIIRNEGLFVSQAITRQLTHYSYHVVQIVYLAERFAGPSCKSLSIPLGESADFNREPEKYLCGNPHEVHARQEVELRLSPIFSKVERVPAEWECNSINCQVFTSQPEDRDYSFGF